MEKTQKSCNFQLPEQSYLEAVFPDMKADIDEDESDEMSRKIPMATLGEYGIMKHLYCERDFFR